MQSDSLLALAGADGHMGENLRVQPLAPFTPEERRLSARVDRELDELVLGGRDRLVLVKLYPRRADGQAAGISWPGSERGAVRPAVAARIAAEALDFFGPLSGGVVVQEALDDVIVQRRRFTSAYPHITLERYDIYDARTSDPLLGAWGVRRIQNLRRETRTNRVIDVALLALEVGKSVFPRLLG